MDNHTRSFRRFYIGEQKPIRSKKLSLRILRNCSFVRPFWYSSISSISPLSTYKTVPNLALRSITVRVFLSWSILKRQCLLETDSSLMTIVPSRLLPIWISLRTAISMTQMIAGSEFTCIAKYSYNSFPYAPNTFLISLSILQSALHTSQENAFAYAQYTPSSK